MPASGHKSWLRWALLIGVAYTGIAVISEALSNWTEANDARAWRLSAWVASLILFVAHIAYERFRLRNPPRSTALHVAIAVAIGAFLLAAAAILNAMTVPVHAPYWLYLIALVAWPLITALPAFVVAIVASSLVARTGKN